MFPKRTLTTTTTAHCRVLALQGYRPKDSAFHKVLPPHTQTYNQTLKKWQAIISPNNCFHTETHCYIWSICTTNSLQQKAFLIDTHPGNVSLSASPLSYLSLDLTLGWGILDPTPKRGGRGDPYRELRVSRSGRDSIWQHVTASLRHAVSMEGRPRVGLLLILHSAFWL
jgi:hypothetical protein